MAAIEPHRSRAGSNLILGRLDKAGCCEQRGRGRAREQAAARADLEHPPRARYMLLGERRTASERSYLRILKYAHTFDLKLLSHRPSLTYHG